MSVIIFIIILALLIIVHEYGHFIVAKKGGIRVDEFGLGYPPKAKTLFRHNGTNFTLNWLPFGGFVKIFGENPDDESLKGADKDRAFISKPRWLQALVLFAGPFMNFLFAWIIILVSLWVGLPTGIDEKMDTRFVSEQTTIITQVLPNSPAEIMGLESGDIISGLIVGSESFDNIDSEKLRDLVISNPDETFYLKYKRGSEESSATLIPADFSGEGKFLGLGISNFGIYKPNLWRGFVDSFKFTGAMIAGISVALFDLIKGIFTGGADISGLTGPIGIVGLVGDASRQGLIYILSFAAIISINLGVINLIPFPALDGGRLLFLLIEKLKGGRVNYKVLNWVNFIGFGLLILLMLFVSYKDILKLT